MFRQLGYVLIIQAAVNVKGEKLVPPEANILSSKGFRQGWWIAFLCYAKKLDALIRNLRLDAVAKSQVYRAIWDTSGCL